MRIHALTVTGGLLCALLLAIATAPARLLPRVLDSDQVMLSGLDGSLWSGRAARSTVMLPAGALHLGELRWRLHPLSLLTAAPRVSLQSRWGAQRVSVDLRRRGTTLTLRDLDASVDARLARQLLPVALRGRVSAQFEELVLEGQDLRRADGRLVWQEAAWNSGAGISALGSYAAIVESSADGELAATVQTLAGPVRVNGTVSLSGDQYRIDARIESDGPMQPELQRALSLVAVPQETGYLLRLNGDLTR